MSCLILFDRYIFSEGVLPLVLVYFFCISRGIRSEGVFVIKTRKVLLDFRRILAHKVCPGGSNTVESVQRKNKTCYPQVVSTIIRACFLFR